MQTKKTIIISGRVDKETKDWIVNHPLSQSDLINYGLYLIRAMERNLKEAQTFITSVTIAPKTKDELPF